MHETASALMNILVVSLAYLLVLFPASSLIRRFLKPWIAQIRTSSAESLVNAGATIGYLERVLMLTFVLLNEFTAVGFILALKAAYRFKDTGDHTQAEYLLMGTFLSLAVTLAVGLGARLALVLLT